MKNEFIFHTPKIIFMDNNFFKYDFQNISFSSKRLLLVESLKDGVSICELLFELERKI